MTWFLAHLPAFTLVTAAQSALVLLTGAGTAWLLRSHHPRIRIWLLRYFVVLLFLIPIVSVTTNMFDIPVFKIGFKPESPSAETSENANPGYDAVTSSRPMPPWRPGNSIHEHVIPAMAVSAVLSPAAGYTAHTPETFIYPKYITVLRTDTVTKQISRATGATTHSKQDTGKSVRKPGQKIILLTFLPVPHKTLSIIGLLIGAVWCGMSLYRGFRSITGEWYLRVLLKQSEAPPETILQILSSVCSKLNMSVPRVRNCPYIKSPCVAGVLKPIILLPENERWSSASIESALVHECAHIRHNDHIWNAIRNVSLIILPIQPLLPAFSRMMVELEDYACDELVISIVGDHRQYVEHLLEVAYRYIDVPPVVSSVPGLIGFASPLRRRIGRLLRHTRSNNELSKMARAMMIMTVILTHLLTSMISPAWTVPKPQHGTALSAKPLIPDVNPYANTLANSVQTAAGHAPRSGHAEKQNSKKTMSVASTAPDLQSNEDTSQSLVEETQAVYTLYIDDLDGDPPRTDRETREKLSEREIPVTETVSAQNAVPEKTSEYSPSDTGLSGSAADAYKTAGRGSVSDDSYPEAVEHGNDASQGAPADKNESAVQWSGVAASLGAVRQVAIPVNKQVNITVAEDYENKEYDLTDPEERRLFQMYQGLDKYKSEPVWSPDGTRIAFCDNNRIWMVSTNGGEPELVYENMYDVFSIGKIGSLQFMPDGKSLIFRKDIFDIERGSMVIIRESEEGGKTGTFDGAIPLIVRYDLETREEEVLIVGGDCCTLDNAGEKICYRSQPAYVGAAAGNADETSVPGGWPMLYDLETGETTPLPLDEDMSFGRPVFSPDGSHIVVPVNNQDGTLQLWNVEIDTGEMSQLTKPGDNGEYGSYRSFPAYHPDGGWVLYTDYYWEGVTTNKRLFLLEMETGIVQSLFPDMEENNSYGKWSPDGKLVCYIVDGAEQNYIYITSFNASPSEKQAAQEESPLAFELKPNFPNPFNSGTTLQFSLPGTSHVTLDIFTIHGQRIARLLDESFGPGTHSVRWDGRDNMGRNVSNGVYIARLATGKMSAVQRMTYLK